MLGMVKRKANHAVIVLNLKASWQRRKGKEENCARDAGHGEKERKKICMGACESQARAIMAFGAGLAEYLLSNSTVTDGVKRKPRFNGQFCKRRPPLVTAHDPKMSSINGRREYKLYVIR